MGSPDRSGWPKTLTAILSPNVSRYVCDTCGTADCGLSADCVLPELIGQAQRTVDASAQARIVEGRLLEIVIMPPLAHRLVRYAATSGNLGETCSVSASFLVGNPSC